MGYNGGDEGRPLRFRSARGPHRAASRRSRATPRGCWSCARTRRPRSAGEASTRFTDSSMRGLPALLRPGDALVFNDTRVIRAAPEGRAPARGTACGGLLQPAQAAGRQPLARLRAAGQAPQARRPPAASATTAACACWARSTPPSPTGRGRRGGAGLRSARPRPRRGDRGARRSAAAALHRRQARAVRAETRSDYQTIYAAPRGRRRRADRGPAFHAGAVCARWRRAASPGTS